MDRQRYFWLGASLSVAGASILGASLFLLGSHPGVSTGMALLVLGLVVSVLGKTAPGVSPDLAELLARTGYANLGRLLEELGLQSPAVYLPSGVVSGEARAFVPFVNEEPSLPPGQRLEERLIAFVAGEVGLLVDTPGSASLSLLQYPPGETVDEMSVALTQIAVASLQIARRTEVHGSGHRFEVSFVGEDVSTAWLSSVVQGCLGSISASIAAALLAEARRQSVRIESETVDGKRRLVVLTLQPSQGRDDNH